MITMAKGAIEPIYMISTRDILGYEGVEGSGYGNYSFSNISKLTN
jgi:hypothetical protein